MLWRTLGVRAIICSVLFAVNMHAQALLSGQHASGGRQQILWQKLETSIREIDHNLDGVLGVAIEDLTSGQKFFLHEDEAFPQASSIKIAVLAKLYHQSQLSAGGGGPFTATDAGSNRNKKWVRFRR